MILGVYIAITSRSVSGIDKNALETPPTGAEFPMRAYVYRVKGFFGLVCCHVNTDSSVVSGNGCEC